MKAVMVMFDTLSRRFLSSYGNTWVQTPNFERLKEKSVQFDSFFSGSLPCMPARRELHTGRYNFLHRGWGPIEPCDFSCFEALKKQGIYSHIVTDHSHYWEDGGATYLPRYTTWEGFRGQEGDRWVGMVNAEHRLEIAPQAKTTKMGESFYVNHANRTRMVEEQDFSSVKTFQAGIEFIELNHTEDHWLLQIEAFDPHEPFYVPQKYLDLYEPIADDVVFEWPSYAPVCESEAEKRQIIIRYAALISMCDEYLGKVLDAFDTYDLWDDTMLIVNTDHGFLMGEHEWWGKNVQPAYNEVVHLPFYYYDPRNKEAHGTRSSLAQTIDIPATLLSYFGCELPDTMLGKDLFPVLDHDECIHEAVLYGSHGGHVNVCDGRYVYMRSSMTRENKPLYEYTLMPTRMRNFISEKEIKQATLDDSFACFHHVPMLKIPTSTFMSSYRYGNKVFDLQNDPKQLHMLDDIEIELSMIEKMRKLLIENEAPLEQYERLGIDKNQPMKEETLRSQRVQRKAQDDVPLDLSFDDMEKAQILFVRDFLPKEKHQMLYDYIVQQYDQSSVYEMLKEFLLEIIGKKMPKAVIPMILGQLKTAGKCD